MAEQSTLEFDQLPAVVPFYARIVTNLGGGLAPGGTIPELSACVRGLEIRADHLAGYRKVCGFVRSESLPITYPHVLAFPLHMAVLTHRAFPLKLLGLIHVRNEITQHRPIAIDEAVDIVVSVGGHREVAKGIEFDLVTRMVDGGGATVWEETGAMLSRRKSNGESGAAKKSARQEPELGFTPDEQATWRVPADIGRRYAKAAGDYNPIHLSALSAKLFGFPRAIATGMWTKARAAAALDAHLTANAYTLSVAFKKPVFLPSEVVFKHASRADGADFALTSSDGNIHHLIGDVRYP